MDTCIAEHYTITDSFHFYSYSRINTDLYKHIETSKTFWSIVSHVTLPDGPEHDKCLERAISSQSVDTSESSNSLEFCNGMPFRMVVVDLHCACKGCLISGKRKRHRLILHETSPPIGTPLRARIRLHSEKRTTENIASFLVSRTRRTLGCANMVVCCFCYFWPRS